MNIFFLDSSISVEKKNHQVIRKITCNKLSKNKHNEILFVSKLLNCSDTVLDFIGGGGSRSTTPVSLNSRKSPTAEMGVQVNQKDGNRRNNNGGQQGGRVDNQGSHENRVSFVHHLNCMRNIITSAPN